MNEQTVYFLQALYDELTERERSADDPAALDRAKKKLAETGREAMIAEIRRDLTGFLRNDTLIVSDNAKWAREEAYKLMTEIEESRYPHELKALSASEQRLIGEIQAMLIVTMRAIGSDQGPGRADIHFVVNQLFPAALRKVRMRCMLEFYRNFVLSGGTAANTAMFPSSGDLRQWLTYYRDILGTETAALPDSILDGRWAYVRRRVNVRGRLSIDLFTEVQCTNDNLVIAPGNARIGADKNGALKISGRGWLTNLTPHDYELMCRREFISRLPEIRNFAFIKGLSEDPNTNLSYILSGQKYLIHPSDYFRLMNRWRITQTQGLRLRQGCCVFCGSLLTAGKCTKCGL